MGEPVGPDKKTVDKFTRKKYIIAEEGKDYVLSRVGTLWRKYKCNIEAQHFSAFDNDIDRLNNAPDTIPEKHFKDLLEYWNLDVVQEDSKKKAENTMMQKDRHAMGPMSFARKQREIQLNDPEKKPPSQASMYKESRKRKAYNKYKTPFEPIQNNIASDLMEEIQEEMQVDGDIAYHEAMTSENSKNRMQLQKYCSRINGVS
ncbi:hypothetical protein OROHE_012268 [Orobanche hederae]